MKSAHMGNFLGTERVREGGRDERRKGGNSEEDPCWTVNTMSAGTESLILGIVPDIILLN